MVLKYWQYFFRFVTKHACGRQTDRQTDGRTEQADRQYYDPQDRASIAASRGKNVKLHRLIGPRTFPVLLQKLCRYDNTSSGENKFHTFTVSYNEANF